VPFTYGFVSLDELEEHFDDHGGEFGARDFLHYQQLADDFLGNPEPQPGTLECTRLRDRCKVRFNIRSNEYGVLTPDNFILTYYIATPARHRRSTNLNYFNDDCNKL
jgi:pyocin large subunit-like protein